MASPNAGWRALPGLLLATWQRWREAHTSQAAAAIAFNAVLALAPLLLLLLAAGGAILGRGRVQEELIAAASRVGGPEAAELTLELVATITEAQQGAGVYTLVGVALLLYFSSVVLLRLKEALNLIWGRSRRPGLRRALLRGLMSFGAVVAVISAALVILFASFAASVAAPTVSEVVPQVTWLWHVLSMLVPLALVGVLLAAVFRYAPEENLRWRDVWPGALLTAFLFTIGNFAIGRLIGGSLLASLYGAAGVVIILLLWVYYSTQILLFGAEFTRLYTEHREGLRRRARPATRTRAR